MTRISGMRNNARVNLRIIEPEGSTHVPKSSAGIVNESGMTKDIEDIVGDLKMDEK